MGIWRRNSEAEQAAAARAVPVTEVHQHEVEHRESLSVCGFSIRSDEHAAEHGARSGREQLPVEE